MTTIVRLGRVVLVLLALGFLTVGFIFLAGAARTDTVGNEVRAWVNYQIECGSSTRLSNSQSCPSSPPPEPSDWSAISGGITITDKELLLTHLSTVEAASQDWWGLSGTFFAASGLFLTAATLLSRKSEKRLSQ